MQTCIFVVVDYCSEVCGSQSCRFHSIRTDGSVTYFLQFFPPGTNTKCSVREQHHTARKIHEKTCERTGVRWFFLFHSLSLKSWKTVFQYLIFTYLMLWTRGYCKLIDHFTSSTLYMIGYSKSMQIWQAVRGEGSKLGLWPEPRVLYPSLVGIGNS